MAMLACCPKPLEDPQCCALVKKIVKTEPYL